MSPSSDSRLQLAAPGSRAGGWLFALCFFLPVALTAVAVAMPALRGGAPAGMDPLLAAARPLGIVVALCGVLWWVMARFMHRQALRVSAGLLEVRSSFYRCRTPLHELKLDQARPVDLDEHTELKPMLKTNGFSIPGFHSGWFLLRNRRRAFVAISDGRRKLWLPGSGRHDLLLEPKDPAALLARLRELAAARGAG